MLVLRAPVGGPPADRGPEEGMPISRAVAAGTALHHVIARVRTTTLQELVERPAKVAVKTGDLSIVERVARPVRIDPRSPQDLIGEQVPDASDLRLIQEPRLEGWPAVRRACPKGRGELPSGEAQRVGAQRAHVGVDAHPTKPAGIMEEECSSILEADGRPDPLRLIRSRSVPKLVDPRQAIEEEPTGHAEPHAERRPLRLEQQKLSSSPSLDEGEAWEHHRRLEARDRAAAGEVIDLDRGDRPIERSFGEAPVVLDFEDLRHGVEGIGIKPPKVPDG